MGGGPSRIAAGASNARSQLAAGASNAGSQIAAAAKSAAIFAKEHPDAFKTMLASLQAAKTGGGVGCGCPVTGYFGGNDDEDPSKDLRQYESSLSAKAKEEVIRRLARALKRAGINVDPESDLEEIVKQLATQIPNPKNGRTFSSDAQSQEKICRVIADVLNDEFTPGITKPGEKFIDTTLSAVDTCRSVGEWTHSFALGVNVEFLAVHAGVKNTLRNIEILEEIMREIYNKIQQKIEKDGDAELNSEFGPFNEIYSRAQKERKLQEEVLKNILKIQLAPAARELEIAMQDESAQNSMIKRLGLRPGTSEFADTLASAITGLGTAASIANRVHKALKQVGISVNKYLESTDYKEFQRMLDDKIESGDIKATDLAKFIAAMNTLRQAFDNRQNPKFREALETTGGAPDEYKSPSDKRVEKIKAEKKTIIQDFVNRLSRHYDEVVSSIKSFNPVLGRVIPITEKTDALRDALVRIRDNREESIELALVGLYSDARSRERKERFVNDLRMVSSACTEIMELEMFRSSSSYFARLKAAINSLEKTIDYFSDVITKRFGGDEDMEKTGGGDSDLLPKIARTAIHLNEAVSEFAYFYYVAKVRINLETSSKELESYGEDYVELLGDAVAMRLWTIQQERTAIIKRINDTATTRFGTITDATNTSGNAWRNASKKFVEQEYDVKVKFYKALQAMDLYMKEFTVGIVKDPDAIRDIKKMLDGTQVIARWFNDQTGNYLCKAFDYMGSSNFAAAGPAFADPVVGASVNLNDDNKKHYYEKVAEASKTIATDAGASALGIPQIGINAGGNTVAQAAGAHVANANAAFAPPTTTLSDPIIDKAAFVQKNVADALEYFQALKNLVNAFARIGDKFGGKELRSQVFMSPTQIYKSLMDYMKQSALSINAGDVATAPANINVSIKLNAQGAHVDQADGILRYQVYFGSVQTATKGNYVLEDRYFTIIIKAMAAKILTTLGVYDMFERRTPVYDLTPTRMIIGGDINDTLDPGAIEGATELYFRLPRLIEFYRNFLRWDGNTDAFRIAMLPELEGIFSGIIRTIFQKMVNPASGDYSDFELQTVVREVNFIYNYYHDKNKETAVQSALNAFVAEINRRYGLIKQQDMKNYWTLVNRSQSMGEGFNTTNNTNYSILPGEDENELDRRAPSDRYVSSDADTTVTGMPRQFDGRTAIDDIRYTNNQLLRDFRIKIDKEFSQIPNTEFGTTSYSLLIKMGAEEMGRATSKKAKYDIAVRMIQSSSTVNLDSNKAFMFHETVVVGLNMLGAINTLLDRYEEQINTLNPEIMENAIMDCVAGVGNLAHGARGTATPLLAPVTFNSVALIARGDPIDRAKIQPRYLIAGDANANISDGLLLRSGSNADIRADNVYTFMANEDIDADAASAGLLTTKPSSFKNDVIPSVIPEILGALPDNISRLRYLRALRYFSRQVTNCNLMMKDFIEAMFDLSTVSGGLIEVRFPESLTTPITVNFSKLKALAESILVDVKYYIEILRPFIPKNTIKRFEDQDNIGSIFWIEKKLIDKRFRDFSESIINPITNSASLDGLSRKTSDALTALLRYTFVPIIPGANSANHLGNPAQRLVVIPEPSITNIEESRYEWYGRTLSEIAFYDAIGSENSMQSTELTRLENYDLGDMILAKSGEGTNGTKNIPPPLSPLLANDIAVAMALLADGPNVVGAGNVAAIVAQAGAVFNVSVPRAIKDLPIVTALQRYTIYENNIMTSNRSLLFAFNQILSKYLSAFTDASGRKIYLNLINAYANGIAAKSIATPNGMSHVDLATRCTSFGRRGDPKAEAIILQSLAFILQRLTKDANDNTQASTHLVTTLIDVPLYLKEGYRVNLPGFVRLFELIVQKCEFIKQFMQKTKINCTRPSQITLAGCRSSGFNVAGNVVGAAADAIIYNRNVVSIPDFQSRLGYATRAEVEAQYLLYSADLYIDTADLVNASNNIAFTNNATRGLQELSPLLSSNDMKLRLINILDSISTSSYTLSSAASEVLKEIADQPIYMQTQEGSIDTYKLRYGKLPLMPLSNSMIYFNNLDVAQNALGQPQNIFPVAGAAENKLMIPNKSLGEPEFKLQYGVRGLLIRQTAVEFATMPGVKYLLESYNSVSAAREQFNPDRYLSFVRSLVSGLRFFTEARNYKSMISTSEVVFSYKTLYIEATAAAIAAAAAVAGTVIPSIVLYNSQPASPAGISSYAISNTAQNIVTVIESSNQEAEINKITAVTGTSKSDTLNDRKKECILSLIDMNIIPINVNALMRSIPLANLYNYEFTFEQMVVAIYGGTSTSYMDQSDKNYINNAKTKNTHQMFLRMLIDPYIELGVETAAVAAGGIATSAGTALAAGVAVSLYGSDVLRLGSGGFVSRIFRGDNDLGMGRPKFLSDQLFNKSLFGSIYQAREDFDEAGPGVGSGVRRGRYNVGLLNMPYNKVTYGLEKAHDALNDGLNTVLTESNGLGGFRWKYGNTGTGGSGVGTSTWGNFSSDAKKLLYFINNAITEIETQLSIILASQTLLITILGITSNVGAIVGAPPTDVGTLIITILAKAGVAPVTNEVIIAAGAAIYNNLIAGGSYGNAGHTSQIEDAVDGLLNNDNPIINSKSIILRAIIENHYIITALWETVTVNSVLANEVAISQAGANYNISTLHSMRMRLRRAMTVERFTRVRAEAIAGGGGVAMNAIVIGNNIAGGYWGRSQVDTDFGGGANAIAATVTEMLGITKILAGVNAYNAGIIAGRASMTPYVPATSGRGSTNFINVMMNGNYQIDIGEFSKGTKFVNSIISYTPDSTPIWTAETGRSASIISFLTAPDQMDNSAVTEVTLKSQQQKIYLECIGKMRFDTKIVRNMFFINNVLRLVRLRLNRELTHSRNVIVGSHYAIAPGITEYGIDPFRPNSTFGSTLPDGSSQYNDLDMA